MDLNNSFPSITIRYVDYQNSFSRIELCESRKLIAIRENEWQFEETRSCVA